MFPASANGRNAAKLAQELGFVRPLIGETNGKQTVQLWTVSEAGLAHWLNQSDPRHALQTLANAIAACRQALADLGKSTKDCREYLSRLSSAVETTFSNSRNPVPTVTKAPSTEPASAILECLKAWRDAGDCPLPVLLEKVKAGYPAISLGAFHDALRCLRDRAAIHLHPWTGPLYELPDPTVALLAGHEIAYYASVREAGPMAPLPPGERLG
jgi:hypothetical protein